MPVPNVSTIIEASHHRIPTYFMIETPIVAAHPVERAGGSDHVASATNGAGGGPPTGQEHAVLMDVVGNDFDVNNDTALVSAVEEGANGSRLRSASVTQCRRLPLAPPR